MARGIRLERGQEERKQSHRTLVSCDGTEVWPAGIETCLRGQGLLKSKGHKFRGQGVEKNILVDTSPLRRH